MPPRQKNISSNCDDNPQTRLFPEKVDGPEFIEVNGKKYYAYMEIEMVAKAFSKHFSEHAQMPNYYITQLKGELWDDMEVEEPIRNIHAFLPHSKYPDFIKYKYFYKAQRAYHDVMISQILSHFILCRLNELHYHGDPLKSVSLQYVTVKGHTTPSLEYEERYVVPKVHRVCCLLINTMSGQEFYLDLCGPQIDINQLSNGRSGYPYVLFRLSKSENDRKRMKIQEAYCQELNNDVKITEVGPLIPVENEKPYKEYLEKLIMGSVHECSDDQCTHEDMKEEDAKEEDIKKKKEIGYVNNVIDGTLMGEDEEFLVEYHERVSKEFKDRVMKAMKVLKNRVKKHEKKEDKVIQ